MKLLFGSIITEDELLDTNPSDVRAKFLLDKGYDMRAYNVIDAYKSSHPKFTICSYHTAGRMCFAVGRMYSDWEGFEDKDDFETSIEDFLKETFPFPLKYQMIDINKGDD